MRELAMAQRNLGTIKTERDRFAAQISDLTTQRDRLNLDLADRDTDRGRLVKKMGEMKVEHNQALQSKDSLFTRMTEVVSRASPSALPTPAAPPRKLPRFNTSDFSLTASPGNRQLIVPVVPDRRRIDQLLLIRLALDLHRQSNRRAAIYLVCY